MKTSLSKSPSTFLLAILLLAYTQTKAQYFAPKNCDANNFFKATVSGKQFTGVKILARNTSAPPWFVSPRTRVRVHE